MTHDAPGARGAARGRTAPAGPAGPLPTSIGAVDAPTGPVLALDLGGTHLRSAVVTPDGRVHGRRHGVTPSAEGAEATLEAAITSLRESSAAARSAGVPPPVAIGISAPGPLDVADGRLMDPPNLDRTFWGFPLGPRLAEALGLAAFLERDTHVAALAEATYGNAVGLTDFVYLTVSTGIGGAVVTGGRLMTGPDGVAGELGHLLVDLDGPPCGCGARGHLERISSGSGMARTAREALESRPPSPILASILARIAPAPLEAHHLAEAEAHGDAFAAGILERGRRAFAAAVVSIVDIFDPQAVIVGGGVALAQGDRLLEPARLQVSREAFRIQARRARIVPAALGDDVGLVGALPLAMLALAATSGTDSLTSAAPRASARRPPAAARPRPRPVPTPAAAS